ncbi:MAG: hypothetical protein Kow00121_12810 [Elainellaceae cyanobacterium]
MIKLPFKPSNFRHSNTGYTLVEMIVVIVIVGILAATAVPGWLSFANSRRANTGRDEVLQTLRQAQARASRTRTRQIVIFDPAANPPTLTTGNPDNTADRLSIQMGQGSFAPGMVGMQITNTNAVPSECNGNRNCVAFGADGSIRNLDDNTNTNPITISVFAPRDNSNNKRCVIVRSLLGAMQTANGNTCP